MCTHFCSFSRAHLPASTPKPSPIERRKAAPSFTALSKAAPLSARHTQRQAGLETENGRFLPPQAAFPMCFAYFISPYASSCILIQFLGKFLFIYAILFLKFVIPIDTLLLFPPLWNGRLIKMPHFADKLRRSLIFFLQNY